MKEGFYLLLRLVYVYVPKATATSAMANMITVADENSFIVVVGVGVGAPGSVTLLLVGMNTGCMARDWVMVVESVVSVDVVPPTEPTTSQHSSLKPEPGVAVKV